MNPILDFYIMAYAAGHLHYPIFKILQMPSKSGKSLTAYRFAKTPGVLLLPGDTTVQSFRNSLHKLYQKQQNDTVELKLIIVEDASKIRYKVREDFYALIAQFASGIVTVDQAFMNFSFKSHASVIINTPPYFTKDLERYLLNAGSGDRFDLIRTNLSTSLKEKLDDLGTYNMPNNINMVKVPEIVPIYYPEYEKEQKRRNGDTKLPSRLTRCRYACFCAGLDENLIENIHEREIKKCDWTDYWVDQITPEDD